MTTRTYSEISDDLRGEPEHAAAIEREKARIPRSSNRPWWRLVRWWDRLHRRD
jgi:alkylated DNA nucleotide flippase Atl1